MTKPATMMIDDVKYVREDSLSTMAAPVDSMPCVLIRSYGAGVHFGYMKSKEHTLAGTVVVLVKTRRVHTWNGAASLSQMAVDGVKGGNISVEIPENEIVNCIEIIPLTKAAKTNLYSQDVWKR